MKENRGEKQLGTHFHQLCPGFLSEIFVSFFLGLSVSVSLQSSDQLLDRYFLNQAIICFQLVFFCLNLSGESRTLVSPRTWGTVHPSTQLCRCFISDSHTFMCLSLSYFFFGCFLNSACTFPYFFLHINCILFVLIKCVPATLCCRVVHRPECLWTKWD